MRNFSWFYFLTLLILCVACEKDEENQAPKALLEINSVGSSVIISGEKSLDPNGDELNYSWQIQGDLQNNNYGNTANISVEPLQKEILSIDIFLEVNDGELQDKVEKSVELLPTFYADWGLGLIVEESKSNNRNYNWYYDQRETGKYNFENCGPTATTMSIKWANESFSKTPEDARNMYRPGGGWWYTNDIVAYLNFNDISNKYISLADKTALIKELDSGNIAILCLDMYYIKENTRSIEHTHKYYHTPNKKWGHFIIVKGYKKVEGVEYLEIYDPNSWGQKYSNGDLKGMDRYYLASDIDKATKIWWYNAIVISKDGFKSTSNSGIPEEEITHMWGR